LGLSRRSEFDDLQPELGGFSLEMDDLLFAVLALVELGSLVYIFHPVTQHAASQPGQFGGLNPLCQIGGPRSIQLALKLQF